ncbi:hypothetical protein LPUS_11218 [Lasallia pustulata]|uniref:Retrotransposon gag domain-containing protein n=1 Tax=Lasallia pustulata TaxID=136370 RepID=A0A1W5DBQ9_9LECA|nr:hypothetical protein LPUS_11218 [Lasallia pustulata]
MPTQATNNGPDFSLCGPFNGRNGQTAARWLKKLEWELKRCSSTQGTITPAEYLQAVELLLVDDAAVWAETTPGIAELLEDLDPTEDTLAQFKALFLQKYPTKTLDTPAIHFDSKIADLRQLADEPLIAYYKRMITLLSRVGGRDRPSMTATRLPALSPLEAAMLNTVMRAFTRGIRDPDVRREALRGLVSVERLLIRVYTMAEDS